jgi:hypothetical protein
VKPPYPRPTRTDADALVFFGADGRWYHSDLLEICSSSSGHAARNTAITCCHNSLQIQWKRDKALAAGPA